MMPMCAGSAMTREQSRAGAGEERAELFCRLALEHRDEFLQARRTRARAADQGRQRTCHPRGFDLDGAELVNGRAVATVSYDIPVSAFGAAAAQDDARERAGVLLADKIRTDLALRLTRLRNAPPAPAMPQTLPTPTLPTP